MKRISKVTLEYTPDEISAMIVRLIGESEKVSLNEYHYDKVRGVYVFFGSDGFDGKLSHLKFQLKAESSDQPKPRKLGLSKYLKSLFEDGSQITEEEIVKSVRAAGFDSVIYVIRQTMRGLNIDQIHDKIWQLKTTE